MIWKNIPLEIDAQEAANLKEAYEPLRLYLEKGLPLKQLELDSLKGLMKASLEQQQSLLEILEARKTGGDHYAIQLQHQDQELLNLPWPLAADPLTNQPLGLQERLYLSQHTAIGNGAGFQPTNPGPLKILLMVSSPVNTAYERRLSFEEEEQQILRAIDAIPAGQGMEVEIDFTDDGSLEALKRKLQTEQYHILHLTCHGSYRNGQGYLELEDELNMTAHSTTAAVFSEALACREDGYKIPLVVLSACQTAQGQKESNTTGLVDAVMQKGTPAVIAMSQSVSDQAASLFAAHLYQGLVGGKSLTSSFTGALKVIQADEMQRYGQAFQWLIPRLYTEGEVASLINLNEPPAPLSRKLATYFSHEELKAKFTHTVPGKEGQYLFIGRRGDKRKLIPILFQKGKMLLRGQGGIGKTALTAQLAYRWTLRYPDAQIFFFNEHSSQIPEIIDSILQAFPRKKRKEVRKELEEEKELTGKIEVLAEEIPGLSAPLFIFDNLETFQTEKGGGFSPEHQEFGLFLQEFVKQVDAPIILTARYPLAEIGGIIDHPLRQASKNDFWKKCQQLSFYELREKMLLKRMNSSQRTTTFRDLVDLLYDTLGGNYRALEFFDALYQKDAARIQATLDKLQEVKPLIEKEILKGEDTEKQMGANLVFSELLGSLSQEEASLLGMLLNFQIPVTRLALDLQGRSGEQEDQVSRLQNLTLLERSLYEETTQVHWYIPPLTRELLQQHTDALPLIHFNPQKAGDYHWAVYQNIDENYADLEQAFLMYLAAKHPKGIEETGTTLTIRLWQADALIQAYQYGRVTYTLLPDIQHPDFLINLGLSARRVGDNFLALEVYEKVLPLYQEIGDKSGEGTTLNNISQIFNARGDYETALSYLKQSLAIQQEIGDKSGEGTTLNNISQIYDARGDYETALSYLKQSLAIQQEIGDKSGEGTTLNNISQIYDARGDYETALSYLKQSLAIRQEIGDKSGEGTTLNNMSTVAYARGDYETALSYLKQSLAIQQEIGDKSGEGTTLNNISQIFKARGDYETALSYLKQSLAIQQEIGDKSGEGTTLNNISQIYDARGDYETALSYLKQSLAIQQEIGDKSGEGTTLNNMSTVAYARGDYETALSYLKQSLAIRQEIGDKSGEGTTLNNISQIFKARGDYETALSYLKQSLAIRQEIGDKSGEGTTLNNISQIFKARGDYETALSYLKQSLAIQQEIGDKSGEGTTLNNISQIFKARGDYETALSYLKQSLAIRQEIGDKSGQIPTLHNMAAIALQNNDGDTFIQYEMQAWNLANEIQNAGGIYHVGRYLGLSLLKWGMKQEAIPFLQGAYGIAVQNNLPDKEELAQALQSIGAL